MKTQKMNAIPQKFLVNINHHPEYNAKPEWKEFTKAGYCALHSIGNQEWAEMMQDGAIILGTEEDLQEYWIAKCPRCGWVGLSGNCEGGDPIGDTGDYDDCYCPKCIEKDGMFVIVDDY